MTGWRVIVPLNLGRDCKTRLAARLSRAERDALVDRMARHVLGVLGTVDDIATIAILSPERPDFDDAEWIRDEGGGLNPALSRSFGDGPTLIIHADLPLLGASDVTAVLAQASSGAAIAPDRAGAGTGTNALALISPAGFRPAFGEGSFALHRALLPHAAIVERIGLATDIDTPDDLDFAAMRIASPI